MLGMSLTLTKLSVFMSRPRSPAVVAAWSAIYYSSVGTTDFQLTVGLPYLLLLVVGGMTTVGGTISARSAWPSSPGSTRRSPTTPSSTGS